MLMVVLDKLLVDSWVVLNEHHDVLHIMSESVESAMCECVCVCVFAM